MSTCTITAQLQTNDLKCRIRNLKKMFKQVPPTQCMKTSCGDWCCSKLDSAKDADGCFMSLPLIYTIEYYAIIDYLNKNFSETQVRNLMHPSWKSEKCVFRISGDTPGCMIYPVRPFSCRVYGRTVPDYFWGIEYPQGAAQAVDCPHCVPVDTNVEQRFIDKEYVRIWQQLQSLSIGLPVVQADCSELFSRMTGLTDLLILGWIERNELISRDTSWFESSFASWWKTYSELL